jgi:DNA repair photolyase
MVHKNIHTVLKVANAPHSDIVIRRADALTVLEQNLTKIPEAIRRSSQVCFTSSTVDPVGNMDLMRETAAGMTAIFEQTDWDVRILSKSNLFPKLVGHIPERFHQRIIFGVSSGTLDDRVARVIEAGTALVSKRIECLHWLQDHGFRTFGMICPSLPQRDYDKFSREICQAIRIEKCEHVWAEPMNLRGESFKNTLAALNHAGLHDAREMLQDVCGIGKKDSWDNYAKATLLAHQKNIPIEKLRFLHYPTQRSLTWWRSHAHKGAVLLGKLVHGDSST